MSNEELVKALRRCDMKQGCFNANCRYSVGKYFCDMDKVHKDAAAAIEDMAKHITEMHERVTVLQIARGELEAEVKRLEPKRGKWIIDGAYTYNLRELNGSAYEPVYRCSCCNRQTESYLRLDEPKMPEDADFPEYCPHCGAKMEVPDGDEKGT